MKINGTGITEQTVKIKPDFRVETTLALYWKQCANGNWVVADRGVDADVYETRIEIASQLPALDTLLDELYDNREASSNALTLSYFADNEHIFGADVVHSSITATMIGSPRKRQRSLHMYTLEMTLRAISPTFVADAEAVPTFRYLKNGYEADVEEWVINRLDSFENTFTYQDRGSDVGLFKGTFLFTDLEMKKFRRYIALQRGVSTSLTDIHGVPKPFGTHRGGYPINVKFLSVEDEVMRDLKYWTATVTMAEVV